MAKKDEERPDLDNIVDELDPDKINKKVEMPHRDARNKHKTETKVKNYDDFRGEIIKYMRHHNKEVYGSELPEEMAFSRAMAILNAKYKEKGGFAHAFERAKKGQMDRILNDLADQLEGEHRAAYVQHVMGKIDPQDFDTHVKLIDQYKAKYGNLLPKDMKQKSSAELAKDYEGLIHHHISVVDSLKSTLKKYSPEGEEEKEEEMKKAA